MVVLIKLKVKYGFPVESLYGFLNDRDHEIWEHYLKLFSHEISVNPISGKIYWLIKNCDNIDFLERSLNNLPLLKEEFIEVKLYEFLEFKNLSCLLHFNEQ